MVPECERCGEPMSLIDETTKLTEYRCSNCYYREIIRKDD